MFCFGAISLWFLFVYEISRQPLNGFAPNSHGRRVWSLVGVPRSDEFESQGQKTKVKVVRVKNGIFGPKAHKAKVELLSLNSLLPLSYSENGISGSFTFRKSKLHVIYLNLLLVGSFYP